MKLVMRVIANSALFLERYHITLYHIIFINQYPSFHKENIQSLLIFTKLLIFLHFLFTIYKDTSSLSIKERKIKLNKLTNDLHIELIKGTKNSIPCINNWKNLRKKPIDLSLKNKEIIFKQRFLSWITFWNNIFFLAMQILKQWVFFILM